MVLQAYNLLDKFLYFKGLSVVWFSFALYYTCSNVGILGGYTEIFVF